MGLINESILNEIIKEEIDLFYSDEENPDNLIFDGKENNMLDEPDIVKELREEERLGKLQIFMIDDFKEEEHYPMSNDLKNYDILQNSDNKINITSYKNALKLAKKVMNKLNKKI